MADTPTLEPVEQVGPGEQRGGRDDDRAKLHRRQHHFPQRDDVAEHQQDAITPGDAQRAQAVRDAVRACGQLGEAQFRRAIADDLQCRPVGERTLRQLGVEPIERPVETM